MSILKKLTRKYKFLRFFNKKVTKLGLLSASLVGLCLSSGASFAKYKDENYGGGNAGVATMGDVTISYIENNEVTTIKLPTSGSSNEGLGWHAFIATFKMQIFPSEIKRNIDLQVKLGSISDDDFSSATNLNNTVLALDSNSYLSVDDESKIEEEKKATSFSTQNINTFGLNEATNLVESMSINNAKSNSYSRWQFFGDFSEIKKEFIYYGKWETKNLDELSYSSNAAYKWEEQEVDSNDSNLINFDTIIITPDDTNGKIIFYKILFFSYFTKDGDNFVTESAKLFYELKVNQVGDNDV